MTIYKIICLTIIFVSFAKNGMKVAKMNDRKGEMIYLFSSSILYLIILFLFFDLLKP